MTDHNLKVQLLLTGNEIMSGDTVDSNSALIAQRLGELAIGVYRKVTVGDEVALLQAEMTMIDRMPNKPRRPVTLWRCIEISNAGTG